MPQYISDKAESYVRCIIRPNEEGATEVEDSAATSSNHTIWIMETSHYLTIGVQLNNHAMLLDQGFNGAYQLRLKGWSESYAQ